MRNCSKIERIDAGEVVGVHGEERKTSGNGNRRDHRVVRPRLSLAAGAPQRLSNPAEGPRGVGIERQRSEVRLCLLQSRLADRRLGGVARYEWSNRQLRECDRGDQRLVWETGVIDESLEQDERRGVQDTARGFRLGHTRESKTLSRS